MANPKIIVVGGGLAGLAAVIKIAEMGGQVDLFSIVPVKRSHSVCAQGGINAAKNLKGEGDSTWQHFDDTVYGGDFLPESSTYSIAWACLLIARPKGFWISDDSAGLYTTARRLRERPLDSSFCMRSMSKFGVMNRKAK
jgi:hypothetical protein